MASFFAFLASSSFIYIGHFGLTPTQYGLTFSVNAISFIGASQFSGYLAERFGISRVISVAVSCFTVATLALFAMTAAGVDNLAVLVVMLFIANAWLGLVIPSTMVLSLEDHGPIAGMASALGGTLQMITGAVMIVAASVFFNGTALPMVATIAVCAVAAFILTRLTLRSGKTAAQLAE
jgi:DHA1 family bicyclomycin/chloramphenicol resistance-like MFS transporter